MLRRLLVALVVLVAGLLGVQGSSDASTTTAIRAAISTYDVPAIARVDVGKFTATDARPVRVSDAWEGSASLPPSRWDTSTTRLAPVVATNTVDDVGLSTRGLVPAAGTRMRPPGVPDEWRVVPTNSGGGVRYYDPANPGNSVRVMQGSPTSPYPNSQAPYVRWQRNGAPLDVNGNVLPTANVPEAHIPLQDFTFLPEVFAG